MALEQFKLDGQVAIVTGAGAVSAKVSRRYWLKRAPRSWERHARHSEVESTIADITAAGGKGLALNADALERYDSERVVQTAVDEFGRIDILVNNVGFATYGRYSNLTDDNLRQTFDYCVTSAFIMSQLVVPHMLKVGRGSIVNISSGAGGSGIRGLLPYCVAKGGTGGTDPRYGPGARAEDPGERHRPRRVLDNRAPVELRPDAGIRGDAEGADTHCIASATSPISGG